MAISINKNHNVQYDVLLISYLMSPVEGVGSARSRSLAKFLKAHGILCKCIHGNTWGPSIGTKRLKWSFYCAIHIIKNYGDYSKIYISCGPFTPLLLISLSCKLKKIPLIIDFRDPWSPNIRTNYGQKEKKLSLGRRISFLISIGIEKFAYKTCEYFIVCTEGMLEEYSKIFNEKSKLRLITNGYDFNHYRYKSEPPKNKCLTFVCLGKFAEYGQIKAGQILDEIKNYSCEVNKKVKLIFIGTDRNLNEPLVKERDLVAEWFPKMSYSDALEIAFKADFGLCLIRDEDYDYGTKVFDYIGLGLPIFDYFKTENRFRRFFSEYISKNQERIGVEKRKKYHRERKFCDNIDIFR